MYFTKADSNNLRSMDWIMIIGTLLSVTNSIHSIKKEPDCRVTHDPVFNGSFLNCSKRKLTQQDLFELPSQGVTTLDISLNSFGFLPDGVFERFNQLKCLICSWCGLNWIGKHSLKGLDTLEVLHLDHNGLVMVELKTNQSTIPCGAFRYVPMLRKLYIDHNGSYNIKPHRYTDYLDIFQYLPKLTHLAIDSFKKLVVGEEFLAFTELFSLTINCHSMKYIENDSLNGFRNSSVQKLELEGGDVLHGLDKIETDVFQHLPDVSYLSLRKIRLGNQNVLLMMKPLKGRQIATIKFESLYSPAFGSFENKISDTIIKTTDGQYLRCMNVTNFIWYDSGVYNLEYNALLSVTWQRNIKTLVFETDTLLQTSVALVFYLELLKKVEVIAYLWGNSGMRNRFHYHLEHPTNSTHNGYAFDRITANPNREEASKDTTLSKQNVSHHRLHDSIPRNRSVRITQDTKHSDIVGRRRSQMKRVDSNPEDLFYRNLKNISEDNSVSMRRNDLIEHTTVDHQVFKLRTPPMLHTLTIDGGHYMELNDEYHVKGSLLNTITVSNTIGFLNVHGVFYGLEKLTNLSFHGSKYLDMSLEFLDTLPGLKNLDLSETSVSPTFYETHIKRIIENLENLEYLNLAENELEILPSGMFTTNKKMKHACLAGNRFFKIPFSLELTPSLHTLDLRNNAFNDLSAADRAAIDSHITSVRNFTILLNNNQLGCVCSKLSFMVWLQRHRQHFDENGNYTCISEDGVLSYTGKYMDAQAFWRQCRGSYYLLVSVILACSLVALYLALFLGMKKKTEIISSVMRVIVPGFRLKNRWDFRYDVFIGYADHDVMYVRNTLLRNLEKKLNLEVFVHHRDLRQDPVEMSNALRDSWRCLLLVTEAFLYRYDMAHNIMKTASFFVTPFNPDNLVVIVEESVRHRIPDYVLQVVDDDNIFILPRLDAGLDYETKEFLRTRLTGS